MRGNRYLVWLLGGALGMASWGALAAEPAAEPPAKQPPRLELRRATSEPVKGWAKTTVPDTEDVIYLAPQAELTEKDVQQVRAAEDDLGNPTIDVVFTEAGAKKMSRLSEQQEGQRIAILVGGKVISAPRVLARITSRARITGNFSPEEVARLVKVIGGQ